MPEFVQGYLEACFFTDCSPDSEDMAESGFADLAPKVLQSAIGDCDRFQDKNSALLAVAYGSEWNGSAKWGDYDASQAGRDFWFTRNGHGVGFWDRGLKADAPLPDGGLQAVGDALTEACGWRTEFPEVTLYKGDNGKLYFA